MKLKSIYVKQNEKKRKKGDEKGKKRKRKEEPINDAILT